MFHHHRPVFASVCSTTLSAPFTLKVEGGGSTTSSSNWATPLGFGRTASPALESEDERSPPSSPLHPFGKDTNDSVQREQLLHQQVSLLTNSIRYLSHKAQVQGLSGDERELLKAQLLALEFYIARTNAPHTQPLATTTSISDNRPSSPPAADLASGASADRHWHHLPDIRDHHLGVSVTSQHKKRAKRTFNRACVHCGTQFTSQWRKGPAGASTLCNACGIRYARRLKKDAKAAASSAPKPCDDAGKRSSVYSLLN